MDKSLVVCNWRDGGYAVVARSDESMRWIMEESKDFQLSGYNLGWPYLRKATHTLLLEHLKSKNDVATINQHLWVAKVDRFDQKFLPCLPNILRHD